MQLLNFVTGIDFGAQGNLSEFSPSGFSAQPDATSTWTEGPTAEILFRVPPLRNNVRFAIEAFPFLGDGALTQQQCWVFFNGLFTHFEHIRIPGELVFTVSRDLFNPRVNRLSFVLPDAVSPSDLGLTDDLRRLGLAFIKLTAGSPAL
jgi:hypothetical protein